MMRVVIALLCLFWACSAGAQQLQRVTNCGDGQPPAGTSPGTQDSTGRECGSVTGSITGSVTTTPSAVTGFGTLSATNASALLSTAMPGPSSAVWPTVPAQIYVNNSVSSAGILYVCPLGGTCTASNGIPIPIGGAYGFYKPSTSMTVIAASTATAVAQW